MKRVMILIVQKRHVGPLKRPEDFLMKLVSMTQQKTLVEHQRKQEPKLVC
jgi:hypothetical protein